MTADDEALAAIDKRGAATVDDVIENGAKLYDRNRDLPKLLGGSRALLLSDSEIIEALEVHMRAERKRIALGHSFADVNRMTALRQAYRAETMRAEEILDEAVFKAVGDTEIVKRFANAEKRQEAAE